MQQRRLGASDLSLSVVGFGGAAVAGPWSYHGAPMGVGHADDHESIAAIRRAVARGVNWIDTAAAYGDGHGEEVVRDALRSFAAADRPYLFTKCHVGLDARGEPEPAATPAGIRRALDGSLRRLGVERIDLYQVHTPFTFGVPPEEVWQVFVDLRREGKLRYAGVANTFTVDQLEACAVRGHIDSFQPPLSAIHREAAADLLPWCRAHETGVIVYWPLEVGLLTGVFSAERVAGLPADDYRRALTEFQEPNLSRNLTVAAAVGEVARRHQVPPAAAAVAWTLAWPGVTGAIVGGRRPQQVDEWVRAGELVLAEDDLDVVAEAIARSGAGRGPARPPRPATA